MLTGQPNYPDGQVFAGYSATGIGRQIHARWLRNLSRAADSARATPARSGWHSTIFLLCCPARCSGHGCCAGRDFDVIFVFGTSPILQAIPAIALKPMSAPSWRLWVQDLWPQSLEVTGHVKNKTVLQLAGGLVRWIYGRSDLLLGQSHAFIDALRPMAGNVPVKYHPNPADLSFADKTDLPPPYGYSPDSTLWLPATWARHRRPRPWLRRPRPTGRGSRYPRCPVWQRQPLGTGCALKPNVWV